MPKKEWKRGAKIKGEDGKTPIAGVDFPMPKDGYTPIKGKDYFDGKPGLPGPQGEPADEKDLIQLQESFLEHKENTDNELNKMSKNTILNEDWTMEKKQNEMRWKKADDKLGLVRQTISRMTWGFDEQIKKITAVGAGTVENLSSQCDGSTTVFTTTNPITDVTWISLNGTNLIETKDFTVSGNTITLSTVTPDTGEELYVKYT